MRVHNDRKAARGGEGLFHISSKRRTLIGSDPAKSQ
jgi:hypothetical protein